MGLTYACGVKFNSKRNMRYHARECPEMSCCGRYYPNISVRGKHLDTAHNNPIPVDVKVEKPRCRFCGKNDFKSSTGRALHTNYHCKKNLHLFWSSRAPSKGTSAPPPILKESLRKTHSASQREFSNENNLSPIPSRVQ